MLTGQRWSLLGVATLVLFAAVAVVAALFAFDRLRPSPTRAGPILAIGNAAGFSIANADGSGARLIRTEGPYFQPRWSSDGQFVAVTLLHPDDANRLLVLRADGSLAAQVAATQAFGWAPSGHDLATLGVDSRNFAILDADTGASVRLNLPPNAPRVDSFDWGPDGSRLVVALRGLDQDSPTSLWLLDRAGMAPRHLSIESPTTQPAWSPDGRLMAANGARCPVTGCFTELRIYPAEGGPRHADLPHLGSPGQPLWSHDSTMLLVDGLTGGQREVYAWNQVTNLLTNLTTNGANDMLVGWDPGQATVVVMRQQVEGASFAMEFWRVAADGSGEVRLAADAYGVALQPLP